MFVRFVRPVAWRRLVAPSDLVSLAQALDHLRLVPDGTPETHPDAAFVRSAVAAAMSGLDGMRGWLGRAILPQSWRFTWAGDDLRAARDGNPYGPAETIVAFPLAGVSAMSAVTADGAPATGYALEAWGSDNALRLPSGPLSGERISATVTAGFDPAADPEAVDLCRRAVLMTVAALYEGRESYTIGTRAEPHPAAIRLLDGLRARTPWAAAP